jgi:hypothetical protein
MCLSKITGIKVLDKKIGVYKVFDYVNGYYYSYMYWPDGTVEKHPRELDDYCKHEAVDFNDYAKVSNAPGYTQLYEEKNKYITVKGYHCFTTLDGTRKFIGQDSYSDRLAIVKFFIPKGTEVIQGSQLIYYADYQKSKYASSKDYLSVIVSPILINPITLMTKGN